MMRIAVRIRVDEDRVHDANTAVPRQCRRRARQHRDQREAGALRSCPHPAHVHPQGFDEWPSPGLAPALGGERHVAKGRRAASAACSRLIPLSTSSSIFSSRCPELARSS